MEHLTEQGFKEHTSRNVEYASFLLGLSRLGQCGMAGKVLKREWKF